MLQVCLIEKNNLACVFGFLNISIFLIVQGDLTYVNSMSQMFDQSASRILATSLLRRGILNGSRCDWRTLGYRVEPKGFNHVKLFI